MQHTVYVHITLIITIIHNESSIGKVLILQAYCSFCVQSEFFHNQRQKLQTALTPEPDQDGPPPFGTRPPSPHENHENHTSTNGIDQLHQNGATNNHTDYNSTETYYDAEDRFD